MSGKEEFEFYHGKLKIRQGNLVMLGYVLVHFFGGAIITTLISILSFVPVIGQVLAALSPILYLVPAAAKAVVEYVYLRDVIDRFKPDVKKNQTHSFIVTILDTLLTFGWARSVYLITMLKMQPLEKAPVECIVPEAESEVLVEEPVSAE
jgi:branched-subunit amino acid permease